ncbi:MAG: peptide chain release factor N(5)-glutamine methyltransferase, partial [Balneolaceae bacterium]
MSESRQLWTVLSMLEWATDYFEEKGVSSSRLSIEWILADVLEIKRLDIYLQFDRPLSEDELNKIRPLVKRRAQHEPLQYITGQTDFINSVIKVSPGVLIPRVETEQLVE